MFVPHRSPAEDGHFGQRLLLQTLEGVALGAQQLADEIELRRDRGEKKEKKTKQIIESNVEV